MSDLALTVIPAEAGIKERYAIRPCPEIWNDAHLSSRMPIVSSKIFMRCRAQPPMDHAAQPCWLWLLLVEHLVV